MSTEISYVYVIWSESGMVKVGKSDNPKNRISCGTKTEMSYR